MREQQPTEGIDSIFHLGKEKGKKSSCSLASLKIWPQNDSFVLSKNVRTGTHEQKVNEASVRRNGSETKDSH